MIRISPNDRLSIAVIVLVLNVVLAPNYFSYAAAQTQQQQHTAIPPIGLSEELLKMALFFIIGQANVTTLEISETGDMRVLLERKGNSTTMTMETQSHNNATIFNPVARPFNATFTMSLDLTKEEAAAYGVKPGTFVLSNEQ